MIAITKAAYEQSCANLVKTALHDSGSTSRRAADLISSLIATEQPRLDLGGICRNFDRGNLQMVLTILSGLSRYGYWPVKSDYPDPEDLICNLRRLHYLQDRDVY